MRIEALFLKIWEHSLLNVLKSKQSLKCAGSLLKRLAAASWNVPLTSEIWRRGALLDRSCLCVECLVSLRFSGHELLYRARCTSLRMLSSVFSNVGNQPSLSTLLSVQKRFSTNPAAAFCTRWTLFCKNAGNGYVTLALKLSLDRTRLCANDFLMSCGVIFFILRKVDNTL